jgi:hypothetical protein
MTYNLVLRNSNPTGTVCSVFSYALLDDGPNRQTVIQLMPGVGSGGQTVAFNPSAGNHIVSINAYTSCTNMSVDVVGWAGGDLWVDHDHNGNQALRPNPDNLTVSEMRIRRFVGFGESESNAESRIHRHDGFMTNRRVANP